MVPLFGSRTKLELTTEVVNQVTSRVRFLIPTSKIVCYISKLNVKGTDNARNFNIHG